MAATTGTATIVFTDLVGSTALRSQLGEQATDDLRRELDAALADVVATHRGRVVKGAGDGIMAAFDSASDAVVASVAMRRAIAAIGRRRRLELAIRVGISAGDVSWENGDCFGLPVVEAARLEASAEPGQILAAEIVRVLARGRAGVEFRSIDGLMLKGMDEPVPACEIRPRVSVAISLLGPIAATVDGLEVAPGARRQRAVLACLALNAGRPVSADQLLDAVWGHDLPASGVRTVAFQISKLLEPDRAGEGTLIVTSAAGYSLDVSRDDVDVHRFDRLVDEARAALDEPSRCRALIEEAIGLWRSRPFADLGDERFVEVESRRLDQRLALAVRTRIEATIAMGGHAEVVPELEVMVDDDPLDESAVQLLMVALAGSGRTVAALRTFGEFRVRLGHELGIEPSSDLQRLEQRLLADEDAPEAPTGTGDRPLRGLPAPRGPLIGRGDELIGIETLMSLSRLVTLCGFGGLGKTRLAQEIARRGAGDFESGAWFVDLTPIGSPSRLAEAFIFAGDVPAAADADSVQRLVRHLADREVLLVVDNCEHMVGEVALLIDHILEGSARVRVLATSRVSLGVAGEAVWTVHPLRAESSMELFADRAQLVRPGFDRDESSRVEIERLCGRLDGIPLAIEMAAGRLAVLNVAQMDELLADRFGLLSHRLRDEHDKHRSMEAVMGWSYRLLAEPQRELLRRMSVCSGGFDLEAALAIGSPDGAATTVGAVLDHLTELVEASLVVFDDGDQPRYSMLETVREYASKQLDPLECSAAEDAHGAYFATVAARIRSLHAQDSQAELRLGDLELHNLHSAISRAYASGDPRRGLSIARDVWFYFGARRMFAAMRWVRVGVELIDEETSQVLEATALALILESGTGNIGAASGGDMAFRSSASSRLERGLAAADSVELRSTMLRGLAANTWVTDPRAADALLTTAAALPGLQPATVLQAVSNQIEAGWATGGLLDETTITRHLRRVAAEAPTLARSVVCLELRLAAFAGRWGEVIQIDTTAERVDDSGEFHRALAVVTALIGLARHDDALVVLRGLHLGTDEGRLYGPLLFASSALARSEPQVAVAALAPLEGVIRQDPRRLCTAVQVASLLAVAAFDLGQPDTAALLLGHAGAEQERLHITLMAHDRPIVETATTMCGATLGGDRFAALAAQGEVMTFTDLPHVAAARS